MSMRTCTLYDIYMCVYECNMHMCVCHVTCMKHVVAATCNSSSHVHCHHMYIVTCTSSPHVLRPHPPQCRLPQPGRVHTAGACSQPGRILARGLSQPRRSRHVLHVVVTRILGLSAAATTTTTTTATAGRAARGLCAAHPVVIGLQAAGCRLLAAISARDSR